MGEGEKSPSLSRGALGCGMAHVKGRNAGVGEEPSPPSPG